MKLFQKRILSFFMSLLLMIILIPDVAYASGENTKDNSEYDDWMEQFYNGTCGENVKWHYDTDGTLTISGTGPMADYISDGQLGSESSLNDYMGYWVPWGDLDVKKVVVQEGITSIGNGAFYQAKISEISLPNTITAIGTAAFYQCSIKNITLPDSLGYIGRYAFGGIGVENVIIPDSVGDIEKGAFICSRLKTVVLPKQIREIPELAFYQCPLETCEIPEGVERIGSCAISANKVIIPESVVQIDDSGVWASEIYGKSGTEAERYALNRHIKFVSDETFKVVFKDEDGTVISEQTVAYGQAAKEPEPPKKKSDEYNTYEFEGWDIPYTEWFYSFNDIMGDLVVTATYRSTPRYYTVTYDTNGGNSSDAKPLEVTYGTKLGKLPKCTRSGYQFRGWYTDPKKGEEVTATTEVNGDMTVYAHWHSLKPEKVEVKLGVKLGKLQPQISIKTYLGNVSGYEIQYSTSKEYTSEDTEILPLKEAYKLSKILGGVFKGKTYYVRARAISYEKDSTGNYVYGDWGKSIKL